LSLIKSFLDEKVDLRPYVYLRDLDAEGLAGFRARLAMLLDRYKILVRDMHKAGVEFLAGTDSGPQTPNRPGSSLHDELELFVEAGLTPAEALRTATLNPARYFRVEADAGTVEVGKSADLVILDANPLTDIKATRKIRGLMLRGVYYPH
jgi:imidazolonepropionase-like amidohydrolase